MDAAQSVGAGNNFVIVGSTLDGAGCITPEIVSDWLTRLQHAVSQDRPAVQVFTPHVDNLDSNSAEENDVVVEVQEFVPEEEITVVESGEIIYSKASNTTALSSQASLISTSATSQPHLSKEQPEVPPELTLSYELQQGYRILRELTTDSHKSFVGPFVHPIDPSSPDYADYHKRVKRPIWLKQIREKFETGMYKTITEFVADMRLLLENCYRFNGPDHSISRKAQRIETLLEQKLALLSRELREKTSLTATSGKGLAELQHGTRRHKVLVSHDSSALLNELRREAAARDREARRQHMMEKRQSYELFMQSLQSWEDSLLEGQHLSAMWEIPQICHFVLLSAVPLGLSGITVYELERSFLMPRESSTLHRLMTSLLSTPFQRTRLENKPPMPYRVWTEKLSVVVRFWYKALADSGRDLAKACQKAGIEEKFFKVLGMTNALAFRPFHELSVYQRVWIVKSLCDYCVESQQSLSDTIEAQPTNDQRAVVLGVDRHGYSYIHFPLFCGADLRVYRQKIEESADSEPETPPVKRSRRLKSNRKCRTRRSATPVSLPSPEQRCRDTRLRQNPRKVRSFQSEVEGSRRSSPNESFSSSDSLSDEETLPVKKPFMSYHDSDQSASSVCPPQSVASSESATVLRRSLRKVIEESKRDAASSSVSNSRESTPPRISESGRRISRPGCSPTSSSRPSRLPKNGNKPVETRSCRGIVSTEPSRDQWRSTRVRRLKHTLDYDIAKSKPSRGIDEVSAVKESNKACSSVSDVSLTTKGGHLASLIDTSDTDSPASSLYAYSTQSTASGIASAKLNSRTDTAAKHKTGKRSQAFNELSKMQSSDSESESQMNALQTPFYDAFPDNSSNCSSICSSLPPAELSSGRFLDNCKNDVDRSLEAKETLAASLDPEEADSREKAALDPREDNRLESELNVKSPLTARTKGSLKAACFQNRNNEVSDSASNSLMQKGCLSDEDRLALSEDIAFKTEAEKDASLKVNRDDTETVKDSVKTVDSDNEHQTQAEDMETDGHSKTVACDGSEEQDVNEAIKEEVEDMSAVKEEPPEILGPNIEEFQLVADSIASLRSLVVKIAEGLPSLPDEAESATTHTDADAEMACEVELHERLSCLLAELEPYEQKLIQLNKKMKIKLRKEHENYVEEPVDRQQAEEAWHSSDSEDSDADDGASSVGNSGSISQPSTPAPSLPDDAFIPGVRSLRRRLVINDSQTFSSKSRKRPAAEMQDSTAAKVSRTTEELGSIVRNGHLVAGTSATEGRQTVPSAVTSSKHRSLRPAVSAPPQTQRAVLRIAQPDGTVCFLAIDNVSNISRLPVTAVVQQLLASQKQASANHRLPLGTSVIHRLAASPAISQSPEYVARTIAPPVSLAACSLPAVASLPIASSQSVCLLSSSNPNSGLSVPVSTSTGTLPFVPVPSQLAPLPVLRPHRPTVTNALSAAINRLRAQNALPQLFLNRSLNLRGVSAPSVSSQQLLNSILPARTAAMSATTPSTCSSASHILPVVTDQPVPFIITAAVTMPSKLSSTSVAGLNPSTQLLNTGHSGHLVTVASSLGNQNLLLLNGVLGSVVSSAAQTPILGNSAASQLNRTPLLINLISSQASQTGTSGTTSTLTQQILSKNPSISMLSSVSYAGKIANLGVPVPVLHRGVTESSLSLAVHAAVAAGRAPNVLSPLNRPQQPRYVNNLTVKTLLENRASSSAEGSTQSSAETLGATIPASSVELNRTVIQPPTLSAGISSVRPSLSAQTAVNRTNRVGCVGSSLRVSTQQLTGQPVLAILPAGVNIGPAQIQQVVAVTAAAISAFKPSIALVSMAPLSLNSQGVVRPSLVSRSIDVGALRAIIPQSKSRAPPSRPPRNNTRTTSVMKAPIPALPRLTDLGLATSSADQVTVSSSGTTLTATVNILATPSATVAQTVATSAISLSTSSRTVTTASSVPQTTVALVGAGNKPVILAAGSSPLVVQQNNAPGQVFLLQSAGGGVVQLVQLPTRRSLPNQQVLLAPNTTAVGNPMQRFAVSAAPTANLSKISSSMPVVQFIMCSTSSTASSFVTASSVTASALSPVHIVSQQATTVLTGSQHRLAVTKQLSLPNSAGNTKPTVQQHGAVSSLQSTELPKSSGLAEAADLFLMAASVVDRVSGDVNCSSVVTTNVSFSSPSMQTSVNQTK